jgi:hypothetical protein
VSTVSTFASTVVNATTSGLVTTYKAAVDLPKGVTLWWRLRVNGTNGPSQWADGGSWLSANPPSVPALVSPASNGLVATTTPTLDWGDATGGGGVDHYTVQIAENAGFSVGLREIDEPLSTHLVSPALGPNRTYWWKVRSENGAGEYSQWSAVRTLRTLLPTPTGLGSTDVETTRPTFSWSAYGGGGSPNPTNYTIQVSTVSTFASTVVNATTSGLVTTYKAAVDLPKGVTLWWRLRVNGTNGPSQWADGGSWLSANPPSVPALVSPASNALTTDFTPKLDWGTSTGIVTDYQVQVSLEADFDPTESVLTGTTSEYTPLADLASNRTHYWRVRSYNGSAYSQWSAVRTFRTALAPPALLAPGPGDVVAVLRPTFDWEDYVGPSPAPTNYTLQVSTNNLFSSYVLNVTVASAQYTPTVNLPTGKVLEWRVRANGANGPSLWSSSSFIIIP